MSEALCFLSVCQWENKLADTERFQMENEADLYQENKTKNMFPVDNEFSRMTSNGPSDVTGDAYLHVWNSAIWN